jgi:hypothetical protein
VSVAEGSVMSTPSATFTLISRFVEGLVIPSNRRGVGA